MRKQHPPSQHIRLVGVVRFWWSNLRIIIGCVLLLVAAFALGTRLAEWNQEQLQPEPPPVEQSR